MVNNLVVMSIMIIGVMTTLLLTFPLFMYIKDLQNADRTGMTFMESATKNFVLHLVLCLVCCGVVSAWGMVSDIGMGSNLSPEVGINGFLGNSNTDSSTSNMKSYWTSVADNLQNVNYDPNSFAKKNQRFISYSLVLCVFLGYFFLLLLFLVPLIVLFPPIFLAMRYFRKNKDNYEGLQPYVKYFLIALGIFVMVNMHLSVVDIFIASCDSESNMKIFDEVGRLWVELGKAK